MSARQMHCPKCGSSDAWCNGRTAPEHNHTCLACGFQSWESERDVAAAKHAKSQRS